MKLEIKHFFDAAHQLPDTEYLITKGCANLHGHTYYVIVNCEGKDLKGGMVIDFKAIKTLIDTFDHTAILQDTNPLVEFLSTHRPEQKVVVLKEPPTSENISKEIHRMISEQYPFLDKVEVAVCEGYKGVDRANWTTFSFYEPELS